MSRFREDGLPQGGTGGPIRITKEELESSHVDDLLKRQANMRGDTGITADRGRRWYYSNWFIFALAGGIFATLAWAINEPFVDDTLHFKTTIKEVMIAPDQVADASGAGRPVALLQLELGERDLEELRASLPVAEAEDEMQGFPVVVYAKTKEVQDDGTVTDIDPALLKPDTPITVHLHQSAPSNVAAIDFTPASNEYESIISASQMSRFSDFAFFAIIAALVGLGIGAADGLMCRLMRRALLCGVAGLIIGLVGGFVSNQIARQVYGMTSPMVNEMRGDDGELTSAGFMAQLGSRSLAWALAGMTMGLGQGIALRSGKLLLYGFLGGLIGGLLGGLLFDPIQEFLVGDDVLSAHWARFGGLVAIGICVGLMIGIVELLARDAWLNMVRGPLAGKEFLIFKDTVKVGASPSSDIYLFNDDDVADHHAVIRAMADNYEIEAVNKNTLLVNGRPVTRTKLRHGDQIKLGSTIFAFQRRQTA